MALYKILGFGPQDAFRNTPELIGAVVESSDFAPTTLSKAAPGSFEGRCIIAPECWPRTMTPPRISGMFYFIEVFLEKLDDDSSHA